MFRVDIVGLRDLQGRFAAMRDAGLREIQLQEAMAAAQTVKDIYRTRAPKSQRRAEDGRDAQRERFSESFTSEARATGLGFEIALVTSQGDLRDWLRKGTPAHLIKPRNKQALFWPGASHPVKVVHHPGTQANPWEDEAEAEAMPLVVSIGNRIGARIVRGLAGGI